MPNQQQENNENDSVIRELYCLGLSVQEMKKVFGYSEQELNRIIARLRKRGGLLFKAKAKDAYPNVIHRLAKFNRKLLEGEADPASLETRICMLLTTWIDDREINEFLRGIVTAMACLRVPFYPEGRRGYAQLLCAVFDIPFDWDEKDAYVQSKTLFAEWLASLVGQEERIPRSRDELERKLVEDILPKLRAGIRPFWPEEIFQRLETRIRMLSPIERRIIDRLYGIDGEVQATPKQIGRSYNLSASRIEGLRDQVFSRIRRSIMFGHDEFNEITSLTIDDACHSILLRGRFLRDIDTLTEALANNEAPEVTIYFEELDLDTPTFSIRTTTILKNNNIVLVGELVQLDWFSLGKNTRRATQEISNWLNARGLALRTKLDGTVVALLRRYKMDLRLHKR